MKKNKTLAYFSILMFADFNEIKVEIIKNFLSIIQNYLVAVMGQISNNSISSLQRGQLLLRIPSENLKKSYF